MKKIITVIFFLVSISTLPSQNLPNEDINSEILFARTNNGMIHSIDSIILKKQIEGSSEVSSKKNFSLFKNEDMNVIEASVRTNREELRYPKFISVSYYDKENIESYLISNVSNQNKIDTLTYYEKNQDGNLRLFRYHSETGWCGNDNSPSEHEYRYYYKENLLTKEIYRVANRFSSGGWQENSRTLYKYDDIGNKTEELIIYTDANTGESYNSYRNEYSYDGLKLIKSKFYNWDSQNLKWKVTSIDSSYFTADTIFEEHRYIGFVDRIWKKYLVAKYKEGDFNYSVWYNWDLDKNIWVKTTRKKEFKSSINNYIKVIKEKRNTETNTWTKIYWNDFYYKGDTIIKEVHDYSELSKTLMLFNEKGNPLFKKHIVKKADTWALVNSFKYQYDKYGNIKKYWTKYNGTNGLFTNLYIEYFWHTENLSKTVEFPKFNNAEYSISPNPSSGQFFIKTNTHTPVKQIKVFNISGKVVYSNSFINDIFKIDLSNLSKGIYFVRINTTIHKIVIE